MAQEFYINQNSTVPLLKMELINDGRTDFNKFYESIQDSIITFTMKDYDTGNIVIANEPALILPKEDTCNDEYFIVYQWKIRDVKLCGKYTGQFKIIFGNSYNNNTLIAPIQEKLIIYIQ